jgi:two-component system sensor histidine kinase CiaH
MRLVMMNTIIFSLILIFLCTVLYQYTRENLLHQVDRDLHVAAIPVEHGFQREPQGPHGEKFWVPRFGQVPTMYLMWNNQAKLMTQFPVQAFQNPQLSVFSKHLQKKQPFTITLQGHVFRVLNIPVQSDHVTILMNGGTVQVIRNVDQVTRELNALLWIVIVGTTGGVVVAWFAGMFLAQRALVPIKKSWEKQQQFVSDASHELRTPLAVVQAQSELLLRHPEGTIEEEAKSVASIYEETRRMRKLVNSLLTLARADSNQAELNLKTTSLSHLLQSVADGFTLLFEQKDVRLVTAIEPQITIHGDEERLRQLFVILLDNALKYTSANGGVELSGVRRGNVVEITVSDSGSGIAQEDLPHIFTRFYRGNKARSRSAGGAGLGLSIAEWIVHAHNGKIAVTSTLGEGTSFKITLPIKGRE